MRETRLTPAGLTGTAEAVAPVRERLASMLFLTAIAHAILILGISFGVARQGAAPPGMEVLHVSDDLPEARRNDNAAYLAQRSQIGPALREAGMLFVGLDVIGGFVTEINVTSPTGVRELHKQFGIDAADLLVQALEKRLAARTR